MPSWERSPDDLVAAFGAFLDRFPDLERRQMFGYPAAFANGQMVTSLHEARWVLRLPDDARREILAIDGAEPFEPMPGRPMAGFVVVPPSLVADPGALEPWIDRALAFVRSRPPKAPKKKPTTGGARAR